MAHHELHPLCTLFPRLAGAEFDALKADISANGLRQPIVLLDGMILDGGNRYRACIDAGVKPTFTKFTGGNIVSFVLSANLHRRHMSAGQQAAIVASAQDWAKAQPAHRPSDKPATLPGSKLDTVSDRAAQSGASERTQRMADKVAKKSPELAKQVAHGEISLPKAVKQVEPAKPKSEAKPKKGEPTIESLLEENQRLRDELHEARHVAEELAHDLESYNTISEGERAIAKELNRLKGMLRTVEGSRNQYMTTANELTRTVKAQQRKIERLEKAVAA